MDWEFILSLVATGLLVVFLALILLVFFVYLYGKIYVAATKPKKQKTQDAPKAPAEAPVMATPNPAGFEDAANQSADEVIAVISAAVAAISAEVGTPLTVKSIRPAASQVRGMRSAWASAGIAENTRSF